MSCIKAPVPDVPDLPTDIGIEAPLPVLPHLDAEWCCKLFQIPLPPLPPSIGVALPLEVLIAINVAKDGVLEYLRCLAFDCPRESRESRS